MEGIGRVTQDGDIELMVRVKGGDVAAFRELARRYRDPLRRFFAALSGDRSQADDFAQETLLRLWISRERYEPSGRFSTYLFQIGRHFWLNQRKKEQRAPRSIPWQELEDGSGDHLVSGLHGSDPESAHLATHRGGRILRAVDDLPPAYRKVFEMGHLRGLAYDSIARDLRIPVGTVKSRMFEAVRRLRRALDGEDET